MKARNVQLVFLREVRDQLRDRRTLFMIVVLPLLLYPAMGLGTMNMAITLHEQPREVLILGAANLPDTPALLDGRGIHADWLPGAGDNASNSKNAESLIVLHDGPVSTRDAEGPPPTERKIEGAEQAGERLESKLEAARKLNAARLKAQVESGDSHSEMLNRAFRDSGIDVLVIVPDGFASSLQATRKAIAARQPLPDYPGIVVISNGANEKSGPGGRRVQEALASWERALLRDRLNAAGLPEDVHRPLKLLSIDVAEQQQVAASIWSKLFPTLLILMTVTGAFYPAIDLGAGEKERGTMETLLICPAYRSEIVLGKFFTVMLFSCGTAVLNLISMGITGSYFAKVIAVKGQMAGATVPPSASAVFWLVVLMVPIAALFSALCLGLATFAKSSKEGQYYLTPLLMVTLGLTLFCLFPAVEITPLYSVLPVINVALLLKGLLLAPVTAQSLHVYILPVLISSAGYSLMALWWAIELFGSESVLFRAAERVSPRLWLKQVFVNRSSIPTFGWAITGFAAIMLLQFAFMGVAGKFTPLAALALQQVCIIALPAVLLTLLVARSPVQTLGLRMPGVKYLVAAITLPLVMHPLSLELMGAMSWFFPELPPALVEALLRMKDDTTPLVTTLAVFALAPAICEELAYRGFVLSGLGSSGRTGLAIVGSSMAFGIMHMIPQQVFNASLLGLVLGLIAVRSGSLLPGVIFHLIYNSLSVLHQRFGNGINTSGLFKHLFWHDSDGALRYQPLLLAFAAVIAFRLIRWVYKDNPPAAFAEAGSLRAESGVAGSSS